ncbi:MAG: helix-turn-helix domain-containing protein [Gordonia sp. (in: high G+C Gram-positive bacteria)]|uniref:hypothetical protein n=1 Tax=Gordonia sp. (in: high G+C Gram-positive bacteria) TaxID=84139 RepID=UPI003C7433F0
MTDLATMGATDARALTDQIKVAVEATWELVKRAYIERAWSALGYDGWDDYCTREFGTSRLRLPREERAEVVASLRESGLSVRAIAAATGDSRETIRRELGGDTNVSPEPRPITGTDGKTYTPPARPTTFICWSCESTCPNEQANDTEDGPLCNTCIDLYDRIDVTEPTPTTDADEAVTAIKDELRGMNPSDNPDAYTERFGDLVNAEASRRQEQSTKPKRRPITDQARDAGWELHKITERIQRIAADDRFESSKEKVTPQLRGHLTNAIESLQAVLDHINNSQGV